MTRGAIRYPGGSLPAVVRRPFRMLGLLAATREWRILPAALGLPAPADLDVAIGPARFALRTRPVAELRIDLGILWEIGVARVYPLPERGVATVDVGAHRGHFDAWVAAHRPGSEIHAYEPSPANADELERQMRRIGARVTVHREAIAGRDGVRTFRAATRSDAGALAGSGEPVPAVGLGTAITRCRAERVFLKMDAEGAEHEAFAALVADPAPARRLVAVALEWHPPRPGEIDVRRSLEALGWDVRWRMLGIGNGIVHAAPRGAA